MPDGQSMVAKLDGEHQFSLGQTCRLGVSTEKCHLFDEAGQRI